MARLVFLFAFLLPAVSLGAPRGPVSIDLARRPFSISRAVRSFVPLDAHRGTLRVHLVGGLKENPDRAGELVFVLDRSHIKRTTWGAGSRVQASLRVSPEIAGTGQRNFQRAHRARLFLRDRLGRRLYLPNVLIVDRPTAGDGWVSLGGEPTVDVPVPLGFTEEGFDLDQVVAIGLNVEAFARPGETVDGTIELRDLQIIPGGRRVVARVLPSRQKVLDHEAARGRRMEARLKMLAPEQGPLVVGVNLPWPTIKGPDGSEAQLYSGVLDGGSKIWDRTLDLGDQEVAGAVRGDFGAIREAFGAGAPVRVWLFGDLRSGISFDGAGNPLAVTDRARDNLRRLLAIAREERVMLIPTLLDFGMADGVSRQGPNGAWPVGEHTDLVTDPTKRHQFVAIIEAFIRPLASDPAVLAFDVMNEPENAVAVVTPNHFAHLQQFLVELVDAVHRAGGFATIGHRNAAEARRFMRGRAAIDLGQAHYYPLVETVPNPTPFAAPFDEVFGAVPSGWGEVQAEPDRIAEQLAAARAARHRFLMFWSWRGHQEGGDGLAVAPYAAEIRKALLGIRSP